jgi:hypothetical protein
MNRDDMMSDHCRHERPKGATPAACFHLSLNEVGRPSRAERAERFDVTAQDLLQRSS